MRPRSIEIAGFTCFSAPVTISFEGMDVFAITGRTGSGKTTIMDAMCYALYGKVPRGTDVSKLIAHDATKMHVSLVFEAGGANYRALRTIGINRKTMRPTATVVQFERQTVDDEWEPLENRVREMNDAVERTIGLDYRAFTRCVLLPQGRFQEMLTGDAAERRAVLEELLEIGVYEKIMQSANRRARELDAEAKTIEHVLESTLSDATPETLAARRKELDARTPERERERATRSALQEAVQHASDVRSARKSAHERREALKAKRQELESAEALTRDGDELLAKAKAALADCENELASLAYDRALHTSLGAARAAAMVVERLAAEEQKAKASAADRTTIERATAAAKAAASAAAKARAVLTEADAAIELARRDHAAAHLRAGLKTGDTCPVCANTVGKLTKVAAPVLAATEKAQAAAKRADEEAGKQANAAQQALALAQRDAEQAKANAEKASRDLAQSRKDLGAELPKGFAPELQAINATLDELNKLAMRFDKLTANAADLRKNRDTVEQSMREGRDTILRLRGETQTLAAAADADRARGDDAIVLLGAIVERCGWHGVAKQISAKQDPSPMLSQMLDAAQNECARLDGLIGGLEREIARIERDIEVAREQRAQVEALRRDHALYATLADLLQANRFRDWYIGEAMALLAGAASSRLATLDPEQRYALQVERGEFVVADRWQGATRSPDTLSGGETFVVSLALALALAEQLPQIQAGAGAALESLFLDEGFGTLDADTLDPVMSALDGLRAEGRLVGIITHVRELAERIGTRIEVVKSPEGSTVHVIGAAA